MEAFQHGVPRLAALLHSNDSFNMRRLFGNFTSEMLVFKEIEIHKRIEDLRDMQARFAAQNGASGQLNLKLLTTASDIPGYKEKLQETETLLTAYCESASPVMSYWYLVLTKFPKYS